MCTIKESPFTKKRIEKLKQKTWIDNHHLIYTATTNLAVLRLLKNLTQKKDKCHQALKA